MNRALVVLALLSYSSALRLQQQDPNLQQDLAALFKPAKTHSNSKKISCGVVLGGFGKPSYVDIGTKVAKHIHGLKIEKGWCPGQPELDSVPVAFFTDLEGHVCPEGVQCFGEKDMDPWKGGSKKVAFTGPQGGAHLGSWKYRWYHAQMLVKSPFPYTLYVDVDALPCSGQSIASLFRKFNQQDVDVFSVLHDTNPCATTGGAGCGAKAPEGTTAEDMKQWKGFHERNAGVILANMTKTRPLFQEWATNIETTAGTSATGDQLAYRQALFRRRNEIKEMKFDEHEVCRSLPQKKASCKTTCLIVHKPGMKSLKEAGILGGKN